MLEPSCSGARHRPMRRSALALAIAAVATMLACCGVAAGADSAFGLHPVPLAGHWLYTLAIARDAAHGLPVGTATRRM